MEKYIKSERSLSNFGGAYSNTSDVCAHDNLIDVGDVLEGKFSSITRFSHAGDCSEICFDISDEEENIENNVVGSNFPFITDNSQNETFEDFRFPPSSLLDEDKYCD